MCGVEPAAAHSRPGADASGGGRAASADDKLDRSLSTCTDGDESGRERYLSAETGLSALLGADESGGGVMPPLDVSASAGAGSGSDAQDAFFPTLEDAEAHWSVPVPDRRSNKNIPNVL